MYIALSLFICLSGPLLVLINKVLLELKKKMCYICTMDDYLALKKNSRLCDSTVEP